MNAYKVREGVHIEEGVEYTKGQVVQSHRNLAATFKGKFEALAPEAPVPGADAPAPEPAPKKKKRSRDDF